LSYASAHQTRLSIPVGIAFNFIFVLKLNSRPGKSGEYGNVIPGKSDMLSGNFSQQY